MINDHGNKSDGNYLRDYTNWKYGRLQKANLWMKKNRLHFPRHELKHCSLICVYNKHIVNILSLSMPNLN